MTERRYCEHQNRFPTDTDPVCKQCYPDTVSVNAGNFRIDTSKLTDEQMAILQKLSTEKLNYQNAIVLDTDGTTDFEKVGEFHEKFKFPVSDGSCELPATERLLFRLQFLQEELMELTQGIRFRDPVQIADALADLVYVAHGTAHWCNLPWDEIFAEVHRSNMQKERVAKASGSKRADEFDCVKPVWWQPPNLKAIVEKHQVDARV